MPKGRLIRPAQRTRKPGRLLLLFCFLWLAFNWYPTRQFDSYDSDSTSVHNFGLNLSMVVPATFEDYMCFSQQFFDRLLENEVRPQELVLVISGVPFNYSWKTPALGTDILLTEVLSPVLRNQAASKNVGIQISRGDLIWFFDIDDVLYTWSVSTILQAFLSQPTPPAAVIFSHNTVVDTDIRKVAPLCTFKSRTACRQVMKSMPHKFTPFCTSTELSCSQQHAYVSDTLYNSCFKEHVNMWTLDRTAVHWCCLSSDRPKFAVGWLLVQRKVAEKIMFNDTYDVAEDGNIVALMLWHGLQVLYIDIPVGFYNMHHTNPACVVSS